MPLVALAKRLEELFLPSQKDYLRIAKNSPALNILKQLRIILNRMDSGLSKLLLLKMNFLIDTKKKRILYKNIFFLEVFYLVKKVYINTQKRQV